MCTSCMKVSTIPMCHRLPERLKSVAAQVIPGRPMADVGTDHAKLPLELVRTNTVPSAIAMDIADGPLEIARRAASTMGDRVVVRRSDGLNALRPNEVATICICGMGGKTMAEILRRGQSIWKTAERLVLQPQGVPQAVRAEMTRCGWDCVFGEVVEDRGKLFTVEAWERCQTMSAWTDLDYRWGRSIRSAPNALYASWLQAEISDIDLALARMDEGGASDHPKATVARHERAVIQKELDRIL